MLAILGYVVAFLVVLGLISIINEYMVVGWQRIGFLKKHPLSYLVVSAFIAVIGFAVSVISPLLSHWIVNIAVVIAVLVIAIYFIYAIIGFLNS
ncbi:hypothetical protein ACU5DF_02785 [Aliivibrio wodanis]|uniref:hypothetical protein n=1 Tax=Aliivibrio wodanis TaxID=80852 RepID=UPI00406CF97A